MKQCIVWMVAPLIAASVVAQPSAEVRERALANGEMNRKALLLCQRFVQAWREHADPKSGLIPRNLNKDAFWNAKDAAADNYPFMVLTAWFTNPRMFEGRMRQMLETEQRLTNRIDRLPDDFLFETQAFRTEEAKLDDIVFGASEYAKDGLLPLTEWLGPSDWSQRMLGMVEDIWKHAEVETEVGKLPTTSHEVAGDLMQVLSRVYWMTGEAAHKEHAYLLASFFLDHHLPTDAERLGLDDHGCEVIGGLSEVYLIAEHEDPEQAARWRPRIHQMLDRILEVGRDENGLLYNAVNPVTGEVLSEDRTDNWGYNYNAFALVAMIDGVERYEQAVKHVMANMPAQKDYPWEGDKADGIADSLEGGLNLLNRFPSEEMAAWADYMAQRLLSKQRDTGIIEGWHGDGNSARTAIMYALWKSLGAYVQPWRADVRVGAVQDPRGVVHFVVASDWPWEGTLHFDLPRHQEYLKLPLDYPRLNQFPEWFTVQREYTLYLTDTSSFPRVDPEEAAQAHEYHKQPDTPYQYKVDAESLRAGIPVAVSAEQPYQLTLWPLALPRPGEMQDLPGYIERVM